ncbi:MAG: anaerobic ribonucleoside-triphosphate reductase activating protein [bacterium]|nr:anaerobic ribonucleoside-triphosphate reductase activating protein [bacterium]
MKIAGLQKCSLVDWPGKVSATVFTPGCNLDCFYCHNRNLLAAKPEFALHEANDVLTWLTRRVGAVDGVVISGGEATLQPGLVSFARRVQDLGFSVKLDTNGTQPRVLERLFEEELLDYVAMDVKATRERYDDICGTPVSESAVDASICLIRGAGIDYEFRTTCVPELTEDDMVSIARRVAGARSLIFQQYRRPPGVSANAPRFAAPPHTADWFRCVLERVEGLVQQCATRGVSELAFAATG